MYKLFLIIVFFVATPVFAATSMFNDEGDYTGNWKQMSRVNTSTYQQKYSSSNYSTHSWNTSNKQKNMTRPQSFSTQSYKESSTMPFRYNSLNYTRTRQVKGGYGEYNAKCSDIGDVSFCR